MDNSLDTTKENKRLLDEEEGSGFLPEIVQPNAQTIVSQDSDVDSEDEEQDRSEDDEADADEDDAADEDDVANEDDVADGCLFLDDAPSSANWTRFREAIMGRSWSMQPRLGSGRQ